MHSPKKKKNHVRYPNPENDQNTPKPFKITKILLELKNDQNTHKTSKMTVIPIKPKTSKMAKIAMKPLE